MHRFMTRLAHGMAVLGGVVLSLLILLICVSVLGRSLNTIFHSDVMQTAAKGFSDWALALGVGPINGDFEIVEAGIAFAIFAFLPLCQITSGHATVEIFTDKLGDTANRWLRMITEITFAAVLILIAWRLYDGTISKYGYGETTFLLQFPVWWAYAWSLLACVIAAIVAVYMAGVKTVEAFTGRALISDGEGAEH